MDSELVSEPTIMDSFSTIFSAALTADPLNLALCAVITLSVAVVAVVWKRS
ncbi:hypothetical protein [Pseudomonas sp. DCA-1]|uniref:hypothetical protein n=1 Tax=Pseudomonas sp. DCA-1 TaxID=3344874 RepID=UPI0039772973